MLIGKRQGFDLKEIRFTQQYENIKSFYQIFDHNLTLNRTGEWYHRPMTTATAQAVPNIALAK
jgi:hypothetical protein